MADFLQVVSFDPLVVDSLVPGAAGPPGPAGPAGPAGPPGTGVSGVSSVAAEDATIVVDGTASNPLLRVGDLSAIYTTVGVAGGAVSFRTLAQYGGKADAFQPAQTITLTSGSPNATLSAPVALAVGQKVVTDTAGTYTVQSVSGTAVTFTTNATANVTNTHFFYGTDNTTPINNMIADCLTRPATAVLPNGRILITGTVGVLEPGPATVTGTGLTIIAGGISANPNRLNFTASGTELVWGGATGGTMMQISRIVGARILGGMTFAGQGNWDNGGTLTPIGPRASIGFHLSQNSTPYSGTGYLSVDDFCFTDIDNGMQFGTNLSDNNCDTTLINRLLLIRCSQTGIKLKNTQSLGHRFNWIHAISCPQTVLKVEDGGSIDIGQIQLSLCGTGSSDPTADNYLIDLNSSSTGYTTRIGILRWEQASIRIACTRNSMASLQIGSIIDGNVANGGNTDDCMFYQHGGEIQIGGGILKSYYVAGKRPFWMDNDTNASTPRLSVRDLSVAHPDDPNTLINLIGNVIADYSFVGLRDLSNNRIPYPDFHKRLEHGQVTIGGITADATTATQLDDMNRNQGTVWQYSYGPRVPKGTSVIEAIITADRLGSAPTSVFKRRYTIYRGSGNGTITQTETIGTDVVTGTDQIFSVTVNAAPYHTINFQVKGTAATGVTWRATFRLLSYNLGYLVSPDY